MLRLIAKHFTSIHDIACKSLCMGCDNGARRISLSQQQMLFHCWSACTQAISTLKISVRWKSSPVPLSQKTAGSIWRRCRSSSRNCWQVSDDDLSGSDNLSWCFVHEGACDGFKASASLRYSYRTRKIRVLVQSVTAHVYSPFLKANRLSSWWSHTRWRQRNTDFLSFSLCFWDWNQ